ncbi:hypothetical protein Nepgr_008149 [Nepenthes gracilis]|uniref:Uncharacterized protein n=1 Tax=Nepenthes gracilis TaxID=150966 RepID=A0AAD3S8J2_NEPGR|nr:hypothetical protein Nepgr_008149 [Nepenthes gracilis]
MDPCFAHVASPVTDSGPVLAEANAGPKGVLVDAGGVSHCSRADGGVSHCILEDPNGANQVLGNPLCDLDLPERSPDGDSSAGACSVDGDDVSTPISIARLYRKYSLVASQDVLNLDPLASCLVVEALAKVADPMHSHECCPVIAQSQGDLDAAEVGSDPLSCAIQKLTEEKAFRHSLNALATDQRNLVLLACNPNPWSMLLARDSSSAVFLRAMESHDLSLSLVRVAGPWMMIAGLLLCGLSAGLMIADAVLPVVVLACRICCSPNQLTDADVADPL